MRGAYASFLAVCALLAFRDVGVEFSFRNAEFRVDPVFSLFFYNAVTQIIALVFLRKKGILRIVATLSDNKAMRGEVIRQNIYTLLAFLLYFLSINSPLGATESSLISYGLDPIFTALIGAVVFKEVLDRRFFYAAAFCLIGIGLFGWGKSGAFLPSWAWFLGVCACVASTLFFGLYLVSMKVLLNSGLKKVDLIFLRLFGCSVVLGVWSFFRPRPDEGLVYAYLFGFGLLTATAPMFLFAWVIQKLQLKSISLVLFLIPVLTGIFSWLLGLTQPTVITCLASVLMLGAVMSYEMRANLRMRKRS